jgi:hypothetical protein
VNLGCCWQHPFHPRLPEITIFLTGCYGVFSKSHGGDEGKLSGSRSVPDRPSAELNRRLNRTDGEKLQPPSNIQRNSKLQTLKMVAFIWSVVMVVCKRAGLDVLLRFTG